MREIVPLFFEVVIFIILLYSYFRICYDKDISKWGALIEISALYSIGILSFFGKIKVLIFIVWITIIGLFKFLTTKKKNIETGIKGIIK
jgi:D-alanyl-lipoteichoic acid acyltransferase DltB (MBOAT superfamily)